MAGASEENQDHIIEWENTKEDNMKFTINPKHTGVPQL